MADKPKISKKITIAITVFIGAQLFVAALIWVVFSDSGEREGRIKSALAVGKASEVQNAIASYYDEHKALPPDNNTLRLPNKQGEPYFTAFEAQGNPSYTVNVANGVITLTFSPNQEPVSSKTLIFIPQVSDGKLNWSCDTGSVEAIYRPAQCGGKQT